MSWRRGSESLLRPASIWRPSWIRVPLIYIHARDRGRIRMKGSILPPVCTALVKGSYRLIGMAASHGKKSPAIRGGAEGDEAPVACFLPRHARRFCTFPRFRSDPSRFLLLMKGIRQVNGPDQDHDCTSRTWIRERPDARRPSLLPSFLPSFVSLILREGNNISPSSICKRFL